MYIFLSFNIISFNHMLVNCVKFWWKGDCKIFFAESGTAL